MASDFGSIELPPRPDRETGEPRPPHAPVTWDGGGNPELDPRRCPRAPEGQGPLLEWYRDSRRYTYLPAAFMFGLMSAAATLFAWGFWWMTKWGLWLVVLLGPVMIFFSLRFRWIAAGADWFASNSGWVKIYELAKVELGGVGISPTLYFTDAEGRRASAELRTMQANPRLWDLVYNGIIHSIHTRDVKLNDSARAQVIEVGFPRHLRE